ncbi:MAG: M1 family aminopeptidase [Candidatus Kapaibacteriota bacterium]
MKKIIILLLTCFINLYSQIPEILIPGGHFETKPSCSFQEKYYRPQIQSISSALNLRNYDVLKYNIYLDWYNIMLTPYVQGSYRQFSGVNSITLKITSDFANSLSFDVQNILIDSVKIKNENYKLNILQNPDSVTVTLLQTKFKGDTVNLIIYYTYQGKEDGGLYLFPKGQYVGQGPPPKRDSIFVLEQLAYTMSEPRDARKWVPCNDNPYDKALVEMSVKLPKGFNASSNGFLTKIDTTKDSVYYHFSSQYEMATYLMVMNASKFRKETAQYTRITNPNEKMPIEYYVWNDDWQSDTTNGGAYNAENSFRNVPKMIENFSKVFGEFPFEKYGMTAVQPFNFGGMEHQTLTTINRTWLRGYYETGIAHELAHQWLGDMITCATWLDVWINEGGATWSEALWIESIYGKKAYYDYMQNVISKYLNTESLYSIAIYGVPINSIFVQPIYLLEYNKASWVYYMLREQLGDEKFFYALHSLMNKFKYKSLETIDIIKSFKEDLPDSGLDFDIFFNQWVGSAGHPIFDIQSQVQDWGLGRAKVKISLSQIQDYPGVPVSFITPLKFNFYKDSTLVQSEVVQLNKKYQTFEFELKFQPDSIAIDQNYLICQVNSNVLSVKNSENSDNLNSIFPNPVFKGNLAKLKINIVSNDNISINVYNTLGQLVTTIYDGKLQPSNYEINIPTNNFTSGNYYILVKQNQVQQTYNFLVIE